MLTVKQDSPDRLSLTFRHDLGVQMTAAGCAGVALAFAGAFLSAASLGRIEPVAVLVGTIPIAVVMLTSFRRWSYDFNRRTNSLQRRRGSLVLETRSLRGLSHAEVAVVDDGLGIRLVYDNGDRLELRIPSHQNERVYQESVDRLNMFVRHESIMYGSALVRA